MHLEVASSRLFVVQGGASIAEGVADILTAKADHAEDPEGGVNCSAALNKGLKALQVHPQASTVSAHSTPTHTIAHAHSTHSQTPTVAPRDLRSPG